MKGVTYFRKWGFSINEGAGPVNMHMTWNRGWCRLFIYLYLFGFRFTKTFK